MSKGLSSVIQRTIASHRRAITVNELLQSVNVAMQASEEHDCIERPFSAAPGLSGTAGHLTMDQVAWGNSGRLTVMVEADLNDPGYFHLCLAAYQITDDPLKEPGINYALRVLAIAKVVSRRAAWSIAEHLSDVLRG
jgi:hypothetical protein